MSTATQVRLAPAYFTYVVPTLLLLVVLYFVMKRFGLIQSREEQEIEKAVLNAPKELIQANALKPNYWLRQGVTQDDILPVPLAREHATRLYDAMFGAMFGIGTDEGTIYKVFEAVDNQTQLSQIAWEYQRMYNSSLVADLQKELDSGEQIGLLRIIAILPEK